MLPEMMSSNDVARMIHRTTVSFSSSDFSVGLASLGFWFAFWLRVMGMIDKAGHIAWAAEAVAVFQRHCGTGDEHAIADLICDLQGMSLQARPESTYNNRELPYSSSV